MAASRAAAVLVLAALIGGHASGQTDPVPEAKPLVPDTQAAVLTGRVVRATDGSPVAGAIVRCQTPVRIEMCATGWVQEVASHLEKVTTDDAGRFRFEFPSGLGLHSIVVLPHGESGAADVLLPADPATGWGGLKPGQQAEVVVTVPRSSGVRGLVLDENGHAVAGAEVEVWQAGRPHAEDGTLIPADVTAVTDAKGGFALPSTSTALLLEARAEGWTANERLGARLAAGATLDGVTIALHRSRFVDGVVTGAAGAPLADVLVQAQRGNPHDRGTEDGLGVQRFTDLLLFCRTDATGHFHLGPLPHDEVQLAINQPPYLGWSRQIVADGQTLPIALDAGASLSGVVRGPDGKPLAGATLQTLASGGMRVVSGADGSYEFLGVPAGDTALVSVLAEGCAVKALESVHIASGAANTLDVRLEPAAPLAGRILDPSGEPVRHTRLDVHGDRELQTLPERSLLWVRHGVQHPSWEEHARQSEVSTDDRGAFRFEHLYPGRYLLRVDGPFPQAFSVQAGPDALELRLSAPEQRRRRLLGTVFDAVSGAPIDDYTVTPQYDASGPRAPDPLQRDGSRFMLDLFWHHVRVLVEAPGHAFWVGNFDGEDARDFAVPIALSPSRRLTVRVVDSRGLPIPNQTVGFGSGSTEVIFKVGGQWAWGFSVTDRTGSIVADGLPATVLTLAASRSPPDRTATGPSTSLRVDLTNALGDTVATLVLPDAR